MGNENGNGVAAPTKTLAQCILDHAKSVGSLPELGRQLGIPAPSLRNWTIGRFVAKADHREMLLAVIPGAAQAVWPDRVSPGKGHKAKGFRPEEPLTLPSGIKVHVRKVEDVAYTIDVGSLRAPLNLPEDSMPLVFQHGSDPEDSSEALDFPLTVTIRRVTQQ